MLKKTLSNCLKLGPYIISEGEKYDNATKLLVGVEVTLERIIEEMVGRGT